MLPPHRTRLRNQQHNHTANLEEQPRKSRGDNRNSITNNQETTGYDDDEDADIC